MTRQVPIPCGTLVRHDGATWTVRARATKDGETRYWLATDDALAGPIPASAVTRLTTSETGLLARAVRRLER